MAISGVSDKSTCDASSKFHNIFVDAPHPDCWTSHADRQWIGGEIGGEQIEGVVLAVIVKFF